MPPQIELSGRLNKVNYSRTYLSARLAEMLGERAAEETAFGDVTTGAEYDLIQATRLARRMISRWGMGQLGNIAFETDEVQELLKERYQTVSRLLTDARNQMGRLAEALLQEETVDIVIR